MANTIVCHPSGDDTNGGGYTDNYAGTWAGWHTSFAAKVSETGATYTNSSTRIAKTGLGTASAIGLLAYISGTNITSGRYEITDIIDANTIEVSGIAATGDNTDTVINVGGALKTPSVAALLAYDDLGSKLLLPANQTTQTINEVDGSANSVTLVTQGYTIDIQGVNETTGKLLSDNDLFPKIKAKDGSTWDANTVMFYMQSNVGDDTVSNTTCKLDKVIFDGNNLTPIVVRIGDHANDNIPCYWGDIQILNSLSTGYDLYLNGYTEGLIDTLYISGGGTGLYHAGSRHFPNVLKKLHINGCSNYGIFGSTQNISAVLFNYIGRFIISNCAVGIQSARYDVSILYSITFVNNTIDLVMNKYYTTLTQKKFYNCLFYNDNAKGAIVSVDDDDYVTVSLENCVLGVANGAVIDYGVTSIKTDCVYITSDPFADKANGDYRLNPNAAEFDKVYDWETGEFYGALGPAEPASSGGGGGVSKSRVFGGL